MTAETKIGKDGLRRCAWAYGGPAMTAYHDQEWGIPIESSQVLWAKLVLDTFQAGLSWRVILEKREGFLSAFDGLVPDLVAEYDDRKVESLMLNPRIVRNQAKIWATVDNAKAYLSLREREGDFRRWLFRYVSYKPIISGACPSTSAQAMVMAKGLKQAGFKFTGPIVCYAFMQATGFVMDHRAACFRAPHCTELLLVPPEFEVS